MLVAGRGLVLQTPDGEIDVRRPFRPVRFAGETPIVSRLEAGPVEVVNLIGDRRQVRHRSRGAAKPASTQRLGAGHAHRLLSRRSGGLRLHERGLIDLPADGGLQDRGCRTATATCIAGVILLGSVICVSR